MSRVDTANTPVAFSWFARSFTGAYGSIIELLILSIVIRLIGLIQPFVFQALVDKVLPFHRAATLHVILVIMVGATIFGTVFSVIYSLTAAALANALTFNLARRIFDHVIRLPLNRIQNYPIGDTLARIGEVDRVREAITGTATGSLVDALFVVIYIGALLAISPMLTVITVVSVPLQIGAFATIGPFLRARLQERFSAHADHYSRLVEAFGSPVVVKALNAEALFLARIIATLKQGLAANWRVAKLHAVNGTVAGSFGGLSVVFVIYFGTQLVFANQLTLGQLIAFHLIAGNVAGPIQSMTTLWEKWQGVKVSRTRLADFLGVPTEDAVPRPPLPEAGQYAIYLRNISFGYEPTRLVFEGINLQFPPIGMTLIVGDSGCGKTTLGKLISGLLSPTDGVIECGEHDLAKFDPGSVRRRIGYVPQDPVLFAGSVRDNVLMGRSSANDREIAEALAASGCDQFVSQLPKAIDTEVGSGGNQLSGGQRQRIALARSLLSKCKVLVLDEPTSSLDYESAKAVMSALEHIAQTRSVIVITHRQELAPNARLVIALDRVAGVAPQQQIEAAP